MVGEYGPRTSSIRIINFTSQEPTIFKNERKLRMYMLWVHDSIVAIIPFAYNEKKKKKKTSLLKTYLGKGEDAGNQHLLFSQYSLPQKDQFNVIQNIRFVICKIFEYGQEQSVVV